MKKQNTAILKDVIAELIRQEGLEEGLLRSRLYDLWDDMLGVTVAKNTRNKYLKDRKLIVELDSSVVRNQLFMMRQDIVKQLNKQLGKEIVDELVLR
jgi:predicted nucleic acid-binding Zn ribbon protein